MQNFSTGNLFICCHQQLTHTFIRMHNTRTKDLRAHYFPRVTLTLTLWPWYTNLTWRIGSNTCLHKKVNFLGKDMGPRTSPVGLRNLWLIWQRKMPLSNTASQYYRQPKCRSPFRQNATIKTSPRTVRTPRLSGSEASSLDGSEGGS